MKWIKRWCGIQRWNCNRYGLRDWKQYVIDGFEEGLIGAKVGDKVTLNLTFPESYKNTDLADRRCVYVTINKIVEKQDITYDNMTDEYVAYVNAKAQHWL